MIFGMIFHLPDQLIAAAAHGDPDRLAAAAEAISASSDSLRAPFEKRPFTFGARSRTVEGVGRCSWALGPSTIDVRHTGTVCSDPRANPFDVRFTI